MSPKTPQDRKKKSGKSGKRQIATAATWGSKAATGTFELDLPSGNTILTKRVSLPELLASGAFPDTLMSIVSEKIDTATGQKDTPKEIDPEALKGMVNDPEKLSELFTAVDKVVPLVVAEPTVKFHQRKVEGSDELETIPDDEREDDVVYTDAVDLMDKMHIFQFAVGGTREVETFRSELTSAVADISAS